MDETAAVETAPGIEVALAWSTEAVEEPWYPPRSWRDASGRAGLILAGAAVLACSVVGVGVGVHHHQTAPLAPQQAEQRPAVAAPPPVVTATVTETPTAAAVPSLTAEAAPPVSTETAVPIHSAGPRVTNQQGFSFVMPAGWVESDPTHLDYGSELLSMKVADGYPPSVANDTRIVMGRLDDKLYANAEPDDTKATIRLASDMGEFFMPYPGMRINQATIQVVGGSATYFAVNFTDPTKPQGQLMAAVVSAGGQRWFLVWLGTSNDPVDRRGAEALADSIQTVVA